MPDRLWYLAYGSNMQSATFRGRRGITWTQALVARLANWRLVLDKPPLIPLGGNGFATIVPENGAAVLGVAYEIGRDDLAHVDLTEGVLIGNYRRVEVEIAPLATSTPLRAFTLISERRDPSLRPSPQYMALLIEGALEHGLPHEYVEFLRGIPTHEESEQARAARGVLDDALKVMRRKDSDG